MRNIFISVIRFILGVEIKRITFGLPDVSTHAERAYSLHLQRERLDIKISDGHLFDWNFTSSNTNRMVELITVIDTDTNELMMRSVYRLVMDTIKQMTSSNISSTMYNVNISPFRERLTFPNVNEKLYGVSGLSEPDSSYLLLQAEDALLVHELTQVIVKKSRGVEL